ncbi:hypothetical protein A979_01095 [Pseudomonas syringae BRIP34876]|nr:hypothetical protein A979_01095 [Pseudomonas syringae BRIP34876]
MPRLFKHATRQGELVIHLRTSRVIMAYTLAALVMALGIRPAVSPPLDAASVFNDGDGSEQGVILHAPLSPTAIPASHDRAAVTGQHQPPTGIDTVAEKRLTTQGKHSSKIDGSLAFPEPCIPAVDRMPGSIMSHAVYKNCRRVRSLVAPKINRANPQTAWINDIQAGRMMMQCGRLYVHDHVIPDW